MFKEVNNETEMKSFGATIGEALLGGEIIEMIGDVGSGKTTLVKGVAVGLGVDEYVQSPSFTINRVYRGRDDLTLVHYDFYRLEDAGIMANDLSEVASGPNTVTVVEWGGIVNGVLPVDRLTINIMSSSETSRKLDLKVGGPTSQSLLERIGS